MELPRLREWRESRGLMQKEVAENAGISEWTVLRAEGGASVRTPTARKIADALGVSVSDLLESPPVPLASAPEAGPQEQEDSNPLHRLIDVSGYDLGELRALEDELREERERLRPESRGALLRPTPEERRKHEAYWIVTENRLNVIDELNRIAEKQPAR